MKYGKKNEIKLDPLKYNLMLIGESGIGKTTIIKEYCEKLTGQDGYMFLEIGKEDGADCINGINYLSCPEWDMDYDEDTNEIGFATYIDDVIENRTTDYKDLKVIVIDTADELFAIAEPEVIRLHNKENPMKKVSSINGAMGGFGAGMDKAIEIVLDKLWSLKKVGVSFIIIGHTKMRNVTDPVTGEDYLQLTTNMTQKYFNSLKTKVHILGVASIDREIIKQKTGKKNVVTKKDIEKGVVKSETRKITFRDDNYVIDSKSRMNNVMDSIPFDCNELINAIKSAIESEYSKSGKSLDEGKKEQAKEEAKAMERVAESEAQSKDTALLKSKITVIKGFCVSNKGNIEAIKPILDKIKELGYDTPKEIDSIEAADEVLELISLKGE